MHASTPRITTLTTLTTLATLVTLAFVAACSTGSDGTRTPLQPDAPSASRSFGADVNKDLATLRGVTARFHDVETAKDAGWNAELTACMDHPTLGGMGYHYGNGGLIDGKVDVREPEVLVYEPEPNGRKRLVAVEYVMPLSASATPPRLFDRDFLVNSTFGLWVLHVWVWKHNPAGMFENYNPNVNCPPGTTMAAMAH